MLLISILPAAIILVVATTVLERIFARWFVVLPSRVRVPQAGASYTEDFGRGTFNLSVVVFHGIFEGAAAVPALVERLKADAQRDRGGPASMIHETCTVQFTAALAPGYDGRVGHKVSNEAYAAQINEISQRAQASVHIYRSWGAAAGSLAWKTTGFTRPSLTILEAPAFSDVVGRLAQHAGTMLRLPGTAYAARALYPLLLTRPLVRAGLPLARAFAAALPDRLVPTKIARDSCAAVLKGPQLVDADLSSAGDQVVYVQGTRDRAISSGRAIRMVRHLAATNGWSNVRVEPVPEGSHWPLITEPGKLARLLLDATKTSLPPRTDPQASPPVSPPRA